MKPIRAELWECRACGNNNHKTEEDAQVCCAPESSDAWECSKCGEVYEDDDKKSATACCEQRPK